MAEESTVVGDVAVAAVVDADDCEVWPIAEAPGEDWAADLALLYLQSIRELSTCFLDAFEKLLAVESTLGHVAQGFCCAVLAAIGVGVLRVPRL